MTSAPTVGADVYKRLGADLDSSGVRVIGDLHGDGLAAFLEGGPIDLLKVSHEDLASDGWETGDEDGVIAAIERLHDMGVTDVVVSRADKPALAHIDGKLYEATPPALEVVDHMGAGDSMTAGLAAARLRGLGPEDTLKLASAAGAANVTRHGLGSGSADLIAGLADQVEVTKSASPTGVGS
jgi:1-phosphofructokinase